MCYSIVSPISVSFSMRMRCQVKSNCFLRILRRKSTSLLVWCWEERKHGNRWNNQDKPFYIQYSLEIRNIHLYFLTAFHNELSQFRIEVEEFLEPLERKGVLLCCVAKVENKWLLIILRKSIAKKINFDRRQHLIFIVTRSFLRYIIGIFRFLLRTQ